jgi:cytoplasmic iron level regulating protein YaaA (DUF328/UPF0246 family)
LVSCTKKKQDYPCKAHEMYSASVLFRKAYAYCGKKYDVVTILSAKYGLISPEDEIEPYDVTLNKMSVKEKKDWSERVFKQLQQRLNLYAYGTVYFHTGRNYREFLSPKLMIAGLSCEVPLDNLAIGKQLRWYNEHYC